MRLLWRACIDVVVHAHSLDEAHRNLRRAILRSECLTAAAALKEDLFRLVGAYDITGVRPDERTLARPIIDVFSGLRLFASTYDDRHAAIIGHVRTLPNGNPGVRPICLMLDERQLPRLGSMVEDDLGRDESGADTESGSDTESNEIQTRLFGEEEDE